ncbi:MAG: MFS transporter [Acidobacteriota bacterium]|nr:MFS transporter [Acidobacteriota bacterium]
MTTSLAEPSRPIDVGTAAFWRATIALIVGAICICSIMYAVQPILPVLAGEFHVSPAGSSLALSATLAVLAIGMVLAGMVSEMRGRVPIMRWSVLASAVITAATAFAPSWHWLVAGRAVVALALCGLPAAAMAYIGEEFTPRAGALAMGLYIAGTACGGTLGRVVTGILTDHGSWRMALGWLGLGTFAGGLIFIWLLPPSRHFTPHAPVFSELTDSIARHCADSGLLTLFGVGFLLLGTYMSIFNYVEFRLVAPPYHLSTSALGLLYVINVGGMASSAWAGRLAGRHGPQAVLWLMLCVMITGVALTLARPLWAIVLGLVVMSGGFLGAHAVAAAWVGRRARTAKALAASIYLLAFYAGAGLLGTAAGTVWADGGWTAVVGAVCAVLVVAIAMARSVRRLPETPVAA